MVQPISVNYNLYLCKYIKRMTEIRLENDTVARLIAASEVRGPPDPPCEGLLPYYFQSDKYSPVAQTIFSFTIGVLISPWSSGLFFLIVFIIVYDILLYIFCHGHPRYYDVFTRAGVILGSILGWIIGRTISGDEILKPGVPDFPDGIIG